MVPELQISKRTPHNETPQSTMARTNGFSNNWQHLKDGMRTNLKDLSRYLHHRAFLPSFTCALLYFTVLSFGSQMITYLLFVGYNSIHIGIARTLSVAFEISATWMSPLAMARIGPIRSGIWFISWQMLCLAGGVIIFWVVETPIVSAFGLIAGTILSRVGLWGFDLSVQIIVQEVGSTLAILMSRFFQLIFVNIRRWNPTTGDLSLLLKHPGRTFLNYVHMLPPSFSLDLTSSSGQF